MAITAQCALEPVLRKLGVSGASCLHRTCRTQAVAAAGGGGLQLHAFALFVIACTAVSHISLEFAFR